MGLNLLLLPLFVILDVNLQLEWNGLHFLPHFAVLFLFYLGFRRPFSEVFACVVVMVFLSRPFTGLDYVSVFFAFWIVLFLIYRLRRRIYAEAYVTYAIWNFLFSLLLFALLGFEAYGIGFMATLLRHALDHGLNALIAGILTIPTYLLLDRLYDTLNMSNRQTEDMFG